MLVYGPLGQHRFVALLDAKASLEVRLMTSIVPLLTTARTRERQRETDSRSLSLLQPGAADKRDYEGPRAAASSSLSRVRRVGGVVGMLGV